MAFSEFLHSRRADAKALVAELKKTYDYASVLGVDVKARSISANNRLTNIASGMDTECGFVVKVAGDGVFYEYSLDDIHGDLAALVAEIHKSFRFSKALKASPIGVRDLSDEPLRQSFCRENDLGRYSEQEILDFCKNLRDTVNGKSENLLNTSVGIYTMETSKLFISPNRELDQNYAWVNGHVGVVYQEGDKTVTHRAGENEATLAAVLEKLPHVVDKLLHEAHMLTTAKPMLPGEYDIVTDTEMTGLIAHEAFGHGVEMDMFVKDRALAKEYVGKYVASPIVNMRDGAGSTVSAGSYFFDDEGVLAGDTQIIKNGILVDRKSVV